MASSKEGVAGDNLESTLQYAKKVFSEKLGGSPPTVVAYAPGRVNLIGEHTDYNLGCVFPMVRDTMSFQFRHVTRIGTAKGDSRSWSSIIRWRKLPSHHDGIC